MGAEERNKRSKIQIQKLWKKKKQLVTLFPSLQTRFLVLVFIYFQWWERDREQFPYTTSLSKFNSKFWTKVKPGARTLSGFPMWMARTTGTWALNLPKHLHFRKLVQKQRGQDFNQAFWTRIQASQAMTITGPNLPKTSASYKGNSIVLVAKELEVIRFHIRLGQKHNMCRLFNDMLGHVTCNIFTK